MDLCANSIGDETAQWETPPVHDRPEVGTDFLILINAQLLKCKMTQPASQFGRESLHMYFPIWYDCPL
jgi:hypothetical protein